MAKPKTVAELDRFKTRYQTLLRKTGIENARIERTCVCKFSAFPFPQQMNSAAATLLSMRTSALTYIILNVQKLQDRDNGKIEKPAPPNHYKWRMALILNNLQASSY
jgi:hypothetical protein